MTRAEIGTRRRLAVSSAQARTRVAVPSLHSTSPNSILVIVVVASPVASATSCAEAPTRRLNSRSLESVFSMQASLQPCNGLEWGRGPRPHE